MSTYQIKFPNGEVQTFESTRTIRWVVAGSYIPGRSLPDADAGASDEDLERFAAGETVNFKITEHGSEKAAYRARNTWPAKQIRSGERARVYTLRATKIA